MVRLYKADKNTKEYLGFEDVEESKILNHKFTILKDGNIVLYSNPHIIIHKEEAVLKNNIKPHSIDDKYRYNQNVISFKDPGPAQERKISVLENTEWVVKPDFRKVDFWDKESQEKVEIKEIGIEPSENLTELEPFKNCKWLEDKWILDEEKVKAEAVVNAIKDFGEKVKAGFTYKEHTFQCDKNDLSMWTEAVVFMERKGLQTDMAIDIENNEWPMTLEEMKKIRDNAKDKWRGYWRDYQDIKNS